MATFLAMLYVLLGFSVVVSLFGMVNTLVLSVFERTRELGMLRAIGMTRRQARRMIRHESIITALIGAALGLGAGRVPGRARDPGAVEYDVAFSLPVPTLAAFTLVAVARRHRRGDPAGPAGLAAQRARRAALRVAGEHPMTATIARSATPTAPPLTRRGGRGPGPSPS